ncbi:MAG: hypothetical protein ACK5MH_09460 [Bacteroidales bacterium]
MKKINLFLILACVFMIFSCSDQDEDNILGAQKQIKTEISPDAIKLGVKSGEEPIELLYSQSYLRDRFNINNPNYLLIVSDIIEDTTIEGRAALCFYGYNILTEEYITFGCSLIKVAVSSDIFDYYLDRNDIGDTNISYVANDAGIKFLYWCARKEPCKAYSKPIYNSRKEKYTCSQKDCPDGNGSCILKTAYTSLEQPFVSFFDFKILE